MKNELRKYIKLALEFGWAEANEHNISQENPNLNCLDMCEDISYFDIFYAENEEEFFKNIIKKDAFNEVKSVIDKMKEDGHFEEDVDITIDDLLKKLEITKKYFEHKFAGAGYYDFWEWGSQYCEKIEKIIADIKVETQDKELEDEEGIIHIIKSYKREISEEYVNKKLKVILKEIENNMN